VDDETIETTKKTIEDSSSDFQTSASRIQTLSTMNVETPVLTSSNETLSDSNLPLSTIKTRNKRKSIKVLSISGTGKKRKIETFIPETIINEGYLVNLCNNRNNKCVCMCGEVIKNGDLRVNPFRYDGTRKRMVVNQKIKYHDNCFIIKYPEFSLERYKINVLILWNYRSFILHSIQFSKEVTEFKLTKFQDLMNKTNN
jgi:hypothetical protein